VSERTPTWVISDPEFDEVSVVDKGDNPPAKIVLFKRATEPTDEELDEVAKAAVDQVEEELAKSSTQTTEDDFLVGEAKALLTKRNATATEAIDKMAEEIAKADPNLTPQEAYWKALQSEEGSAIRKARRELPYEPPKATVHKHHRVREMEEADAMERSAGRAVLSTIEKRAQAIQKESADRGLPMAATEAYKLAMNEERELVKSYRETF
jgi:hypothetical protein